MFCEKHAPKKGVIACTKLGPGPFLPDEKGSAKQPIDDDDGEDDATERPVFIF